MDSGFVRVRGAREHNLKNVDLDIPREALVTVVVVEHDMRVVAGSDWVIDIGPGAGDEGGRVVAAGPPADVARNAASRTVSYLSRLLGADRRTRAAAAG